MHFPPSWIPVSGRALTGVWNKNYSRKLSACFLAFCFAAWKLKGWQGSEIASQESLLDTTHPCCSCSSRLGSPGWAPAIGTSGHSPRALQGEVSGAQRPEELTHKPSLLSFLLSNFCHLEGHIQPTSVVSVMLGRVWYPVFFLLAAALWQKFWIQCHKYPTPATTMSAASSLSTFDTLSTLLSSAGLGVNHTCICTANFHLLQS